MSSVPLLAILIPALPLAAAVLTAVFGPRVLVRYSHLPAVVGIASSCICSLILAAAVRDGLPPPAGRIGYEQVVPLWTWAEITNGAGGEDARASYGDPLAGGPTSAFHIDIALQIDPLTALMLVVVTLVSTLVAIFSIGYMRGERGEWRFFSFISLFVFSMTMLVAASNFLLLFVFWETVGVCSYFLIGFWYQKQRAAAAGTKAFLVNRVGDAGFVVGLFLIWVTYGTWNFHDVGQAAGVLGQTRLAANAYVGGGMGLAICLLLLLGACGKSAQFPLHVWLADAMEGPTPVSALIHAATMVTAGVYMVARCAPLFIVSPPAQLIVACIGGGTALMAALIAVTQFDLKRILAYSTISQLGLMFLGLGTGTLAGITAGMFHLCTHAFFKALLFLGAGSVMHAMGGVIDIRRLGGLRRAMPITHWTFAVGCLALAGVFPLAGFWSKDAILGAVHDRSREIEEEIVARATRSETKRANDTSLSSGDGAENAVPAHAVAHVVTELLAPRTTAELVRARTIYHALYYLALATSFLTAIYIFRVFFRTFYGPDPTPDDRRGPAHESPPVMWVPLAVLAGFSIAFGFALQANHFISNLLGYTPSLAAIVSRTPSVAAFHMGVALTSTLVAVAGIGLAAYLYLGDYREAAVLSRLLGGLYRLARDKFWFDEIYSAAVVRPLRGLAGLCAAVDWWLIDGIVNACGWIPRAAGNVLRRLQIGFIPFYGLAMVLGVLALVAARLLSGP
jgi:NADH-quinone oxidoreductase subunit L